MPDLPLLLVCARGQLCRAACTGHPGGGARGTERSIASWGVLSGPSLPRVTPVVIGKASAGLQQLCYQSLLLHFPC